MTRYWRRLREWLRTPDARWLLAVFVVALIVRLLVAVTVTPNPRDGRFDDSVWYDTAARHIAAGDGYVSDVTVWVDADGNRIYPDMNDLTPTALWPPGYPFTLAAIYVVTDDSVTAARMMNVLWGALTAAIVFLIARKLFDATVAAFSGMALAFMPSHVLFTSVLLAETYFGFLLALVLAISVYFVFDRRKPNLALMFGLGALVAFTGYVRGEFLLFGVVLALLVLLHLRRDALLPLAALAAGALLIVVPWTVRNARSMDEPIVGTTGAGRTMYQGHNPDADGQPSLTAAFILEGKFPGLSRNELEVQSNREGSRLAREWALDHKTRELQLIGLRMYHLMKTDEAGVTWLQSNKPWFSPDNRDKLIYFSTFWFYSLIALTLASMPIWWRWRGLSRWLVFSVIPFNMLIFGVLFIGDPRYHYAMYVPLAVFAGVGLAAVARMTVHQWREVNGPARFGALRTFDARGA
jgi:4-amino-4-deoxy-L-arabinose transferase-like glycosyltransferase